MHPDTKLWHQNSKVPQAISYSVQWRTRAITGLGGDWTEDIVRGGFYLCTRK